MNTPLHLEERLQHDIEQVRGQVMAMGKLVDQALQASTQALLKQNRRLAYVTILRDRFVDELETEVDQLCLEFLVRHQPVAAHLRFVFTVLHINRELERIGDYAESISRQVLALQGASLGQSASNFTDLSGLAIRMVAEALRAFEQQDLALAERALPLEEEANRLRDEINAQLSEQARLGQLPEAALSPLVTVARRLERVTDQAKNICEEVVYLCTGEFAKHKDTGLLRVLFVDEQNAGLAQMAEHIARDLHFSGAAFASAGITPGSLSQPLVNFMSTKGLETEGLLSRSLDQVPDWQHYPVIVALGQSVRERLPKHPNKIVCFTWQVPDPFAGNDPNHPDAALFEPAYQFLKTNIRDLVDAVLESPKI